MEREWKLTGALLREGLDITIKYLEGALRCFGEPIPPEVAECLAVEADFGYMLVLYGAGPDDLRELIGRLRSLREGLAGRFAEPSAPELARAIVEIDPIAARFPVAADRMGAVERMRRDGRIEAFGEPPTLVPVRGADKGGAERRIAWLLSQLGVPANGRQELPSEAAEGRAA